MVIILTEVVIGILAGGGTQPFPLPIKKAVLDFQNGPIGDIHLES